MAREKKIKISLKELKIKELYEFYLQNGFNFTVEEIAQRMNIERKTFYNRYHSREESVRMVVNYEHKIFTELFQEKKQQCNHPVEELVMLIWMMQRYYQERPFFFEYDVTHHRFISNEIPLRKEFETIVEKGIQCYHIQEDINMPLYTDFFFFNIQNYIMQKRKQVGFVRYTLLPLLNERGLELLDELELETFLG